MRNFFIIHGANGGADASWGGWLKSRLEKYGEVIMPSFPIGENAKLHLWKEVFEKYKDKINEDSIFICHSIGCLVSVRYLTENNLKINAVVFVAGPGSKTISNKDEEKKKRLEALMKPFLPSLKIKQKFQHLAKKRFAVYSDNDHILGIRSLKAFAKSVNACEVLVRGKGHFGRVANIKEIPEVLEIVESVVC